MTDQQGQFWILKKDEQKKLLVDEILSLSLSKPKYVKIEDKIEPRSDRQNRYIWGWVYDQIKIALDEAGITIPCEGGREHPYTVDVLHEIFKRKFLLQEVIETRGKRGQRRSLEMFKSTAKLNKKEFSTFVGEVKNFAYQFWGVTIPTPNRGFWHDYYKSLGIE